MARGCNWARQAVEKTSNINCTACILGYIERGRFPVAKDKTLLTIMGVSAIQELIVENNNVMIVEGNNQLLTVPLYIAVKHNEKVSENFISAQENILALTA